MFLLLRSNLSPDFPQKTRCLKLWYTKAISMLQSKSSQLIIVLLRVALGWLFFYAGITKVLNPEWSAAGYLGAAKTFNGFYSFLLQPDILPIINMVNKWGLVLLGASLMLGLFVRFSSVLGILLMALYYVP